MVARKEKQAEPTKVFCKDCYFGGTVENFLIDCSNKAENPGGYKMGCWARNCTNYKAKK
jgi:hypothetical protein